MSAARAASTTRCTCPTVEVCVRGELDVATVPRMRERLHDALTLRPTHLYVDLTECGFLDACGILLLLDVHRQAWCQGATFVLRGCSPRHRRLLALMGLEDVFDLGDVSPCP